MSQNNKQKPKTQAKKLAAAILEAKNAHIEEQFMHAEHLVQLGLWRDAKKRRQAALDALAAIMGES